jgi:crotonobetainyl-CoA:carnitine CoA-transferase CaiB-like acyl-CoA transferase
VCEVTDPLYGRIDAFGPVPKLSKSPGRINAPAKPVGWHNERVFAGLLGLSAAEMEELTRKKVIGAWDDLPGYGETVLAAPPWKMSGTPPRWKSGWRLPGADNRDVYAGNLGMPEEEYRRLAPAEVI